MIIKYKNQNDIINSDLINSYEIEYIFNDSPINRYQNTLLLHYCFDCHKLKVLKNNLINT